MSSTCFQGQCFVVKYKAYYICHMNFPDSFFNETRESISFEISHGTRKGYHDITPAAHEPTRRPTLNKSTASGAIYARSSPYGLCHGEVDTVKRGPKLNLIKNWGKGGGRG